MTNKSRYGKIIQKIELIWILRLSDIYGNEETEYLAKIGLNKNSIIFDY